MDATPAPAQPQDHRLLATLIEAIDTRALVFDLLAGWIAWVAILFWGSVHTSVSAVSFYGLMEHIDNHWRSAFFWSLPVVLVVSLVHHLRLGRPWHAALTAGILYVGPVTLGHLGFALLDEVYRNTTFARDAQRTMGFVLIVFYLVGIVYLAVKARRRDSQAIAALLVPPYVVAVLCVSAGFFQVLTSVEYRYRNALLLTVQTIENQSGIVHISGTLQVKKPAAYVFSAVGNNPSFVPEDDPAPAKIIWKAASPSSVGDYPFDIICKAQKPPGAHPAPGANNHDGGPYGDYDNEPLVYLQIAVKNKAGIAPKTLRSIPIGAWYSPAYMPGAKASGAPVLP